MSLHCLYGCRNLFGENHFGIFSPLVIKHFLSGLLECFLHVRCMPHQNCNDCSEQVCVCVKHLKDVKLLRLVFHAGADFIALFL